MHGGGRRGGDECRIKYWRPQLSPVPDVILSPHRQASGRGCLAASTAIRLISIDNLVACDQPELPDEIRPKARKEESERRATMRSRGQRIASHTLILKRTDLSLLLVDLVCETTGGSQGGCRLCEPFLLPLEPLLQLLPPLLLGLNPTFTFLPLVFAVCGRLTGQQASTE